MKNKYYITIAIIVFIVCIVALKTIPIPKVAPDSEYLTNDQIIQEVHKCEKAGLDAGYTYNGWNGRIRHIICKPK